MGRVNQEIPKLSDAQFAAFIEGLDSEDRQEFFYALGGNERQARFVACIDLLMVGGVAEGGRKGSLQEAYMMATGCSKERAEKECYEHYHHPAVQSLLSRLRYRTRALFWTSIEMKYMEFIKSQIDRAMERGASEKDREIALKAGQSFSASIRQEEVAARSERTKLGMDRARRGALEAGQMPDAEKVVSWLRELKRLYGPDEFARLINDSDTPILPVA